MGQINTNNYPTVDSLLDADLLIVENATNGTGTTTPKQLRENAIGTDTLQTSAQTVTGAINELKGEIDAGAGVVCYDVDTITSGYLGGQFSGSANLLLLHLTTDGTADASNGYMMMLSYTRPVARFAYGQLVDVDGVVYKQDVYADNTIICKISDSGTGTESDPKQVVILGIINAGFMLTPTAVVSDRDIIDGQGNTLSVLAEALTKTVSGNPVVISDCAGGKARSLKTTIEAIQDLHGYDKPWVGGAGKNKLKVTATSTTVSGVTFTVNSDGTVKVNGTATDTVIFRLSSDISLTQGADYKFNGCTTDTFNCRLDLTGNTTSSESYTNINNDTSFTAGQTSYRASIIVNSGYTANNVMFYPMIRLSTETDPTFAPYSNICPISGRTAVAVERIGKNLLPMTVSAIKSANTTGTWNGNVYSIANGTIEILVDGSNYIKGFKVNGTFNSAVSFYVTPTNLSLESNGRIYSGITTGSDQTYFLYFDGAGVQVNTSEVTITTGRNPIRFVRIVIRSGAVLNNVLFYPMMRDSSISDSTYEPYKDINATIQLGTTVYGGEVNWDTGVMTITDVILVNNTADMDNSEDWPGWRTSGIRQYIGGGINRVFTGQTMNVGTVYGANTTGSDDTLILPKDTYNLSQTEWKALATDVQILVPLATPQTIQLTPTQLEMLKGYNRVTIDNGSIELGYIAKLT